MLNWRATTYSTTKSTIRLCDIVENFVENSENSIEPFNLWNFDYPSYYQGDEKKAFEQKVIDHFYFREIGFETVGRFHHYFKSKVREIMPYYIQLYKSQELMQSIEDPFGNVNVTEKWTETRTGTSSGTTSDTSESTTTGESSSSQTGQSTTQSSDKMTRKFSNTPQGTIANLDKYMTEATTEEHVITGNENTQGTNKNTTEGTATATANGTSSSENSETIEHTFTKVGNQGVNTYAHDMEELRKTFLNIDMMIINDLSELFLKIY